MTTIPAHYNYVAVPEAAAVAAGIGSPVAREVNAPTNSPRIIIEVLLYTAIVYSLFLEQFGRVPYLAAGLFDVSGLLCLVFIVLTGERVPITFWWGLAMNIGANVSQVLGHGEMPLLGEGLPLMLHWLAAVLMMTYIVRNEGARKRALLFLSTLVIATVKVKGRQIGGFKRLGLEDIGASLANPNAIGYVTGLFCVAILFWSLRASKVFRPVLWAYAAALAYCTILSVSRIAVLVLFAGLLVLMVAILAGRGTRAGGIILVVVAVLAVSQLGYLFAGAWATLEKRFAGADRRSTESRTRLYDIRTLGDLAQTLIIGTGPANAIVSSTGIPAHHTFVYVHQAYGGITAWPFLAWTVILARRSWRLLKARDFPHDTKLLVVALFGMVVGEYLTNNLGFVGLSGLYGIAVIEKYTSPYSSRRMAERAATPGRLRAPVTNWEPASAIVPR